MKTFAIVENGKVSNLVVAEYPLEANWIETSQATIGDLWDGVSFIKDTTAEEAKAAAAVREERNEKLKKTDWTQVADAPVDKAVWATYRQALRDVSTQTGFPWDVQWPIEP